MLLFKDHSADAKNYALQRCAALAREYLDGLRPGHYFYGIHAEARKHFFPGSAGYEMFVRCCEMELDAVAIDVDSRGYIISVARGLH